METKSGRICTLHTENLESMNNNQSFTPAHKHITVISVIIFLLDIAYKQKILQVHFYIIQTENLENTFSNSVVI